MDVKEFFMIVGLIALICAPFLAYVTHIIWWINLCMTEKMDTFGEAFLALVGTVFPPIGMIHGFILWF